jgi:cytochrome c oxidase subunit II
MFSTFGGEVDGVFWLIFHITAVWFFLTEGLILYLVFRYRRKPGRKTAYVRGDTWRQFAWVLVPSGVVVVLDVAIDVSGGEVWAKTQRQMPETDIVVRAAGKRFNWEFTYPGPTGSSGRRMTCSWTMIYTWDYMHLKTRKRSLTQLRLFQ